MPRVHIAGIDRVQRKIRPAATRAARQRVVVPLGAIVESVDRAYHEIRQGRREAGTRAVAQILVDHHIDVRGADEILQPYRLRAVEEARG